MSPIDRPWAAVSLNVAVVAVAVTPARLLWLEPARNQQLRPGWSEYTPVCEGGCRSRDEATAVELRMIRLHSLVPT